jgi:hypothetical protein
MILKQRSDIILREIDDEILLMDNQAMQIHQLNRTASYIWSRCDGSTSTDEIIEQVAREFDVEDHVATKQVKELIAQLVELKVLTPV